MKTRTATRDERGVAAVELALFLPLLALLMAVTVGVVRLVADQNHLNQITETTARYATRAAADPARPGPYRARPTSEEVAAYAAEISDLPIVGVEVTPDPTTAFPGDDIAVVVTVQHDAGPLAGVANALAGLLGQGDVFPDGGVQLRSAVTMREE